MCVCGVDIRATCMCGVDRERDLDEMYNEFYLIRESHSRETKNEYTRTLEKWWFKSFRLSCEQTTATMVDRSIQISRRYGDKLWVFYFYKRTWKLKRLTLPLAVIPMICYPLSFFFYILASIQQRNYPFSCLKWSVVITFIATWFASINSSKIFGNLLSHDLSFDARNTIININPEVKIDGYIDDDDFRH